MVRLALPYDRKENLVGAFVIALMWVIAFVAVGIISTRTYRAVQFRKLELEENRRALAQASREHELEVQLRERALEAQQRELTMEASSELENARLANEAARLELDTARKIAERELEEGRTRLELEQATATAAAVDEALLQERIDAERALVEAQRDARIAHAEELVEAEIALAKRQGDVQILSDLYDKYVSRELDAHKEFLRRVPSYSATPFKVKSFDQWAGGKFKDGRYSR